MNKTFSAIIATIALTTPALADVAQNKETALAYYQALHSDQDVAQFVAEDYTEHQQGSDFTLDGLLALTRQHDGAVTVHRIIAQDDLVFLHVEQQDGEGSIARGELFRLNEDGLVVEHWGNHQAAIPASETKSGNSMFDGVTEVNMDSQASVTYGQAHLKTMDIFWNTFDASVISGALTDAYIQHNPGGVNGPEGMLGLVGFLQSQEITLEKELHQSVAEGDFIVKLNFYRSTPAIPGFGQVFVFDVIRLAEDGRADEHWDIAEEIADIDDLGSLY